MPKGRKQIILKEHRDTGDSFSSIMKNTRDLSSVHEKMLEISRTVKECTHFMKIMSNLLQLGETAEKSAVYSLANWMNFEVDKCFEGIDIPRNHLGLYEYRDVPKSMSEYVDTRYNMLMDSFTVMNLICICKNMHHYKQYLCVETDETITHRSGRTKTKKIIRDLTLDRAEWYALATKLFNAIPGNVFKPFTLKTMDELMARIDDGDADGDDDGDDDVTVRTTPSKIALADHVADIEIVVRGCCAVDLKELYVNNLDNDDYRYALIASCAKLYVRTHRVSQAIRIPDMDPSKLRNAIEAGLERYKNERVIQSNAAAYRELCDSVAMLEENFDGYYNNYVKTGNIANIFEQYVFDVAEEKKDKKHMKVQFSRIIQFFRMKAAPIIQNSKSPELQHLFNTADKKFSSFLSDAEKLDVEASAELDAEYSASASGVSMLESLRQSSTPILESAE